MANPLVNYPTEDRLGIMTAIDHLRGEREILHPLDSYGQAVTLLTDSSTVQVPRTNHRDDIFHIENTTLTAPPHLPATD